MLSGKKVPGLSLAFEIERKTADWGHGPIRAEEWLAASRAKKAA